MIPSQLWYQLEQESSLLAERIRLLDDPAEAFYLMEAERMVNQMLTWPLHGETVTLETWEKAQRWWGFIQGIFYCTGTYTIDQMREHNRTPNQE